MRTEFLFNKVIGRNEILYNIYEDDRQKQADGSGCFMQKEA